MGLLNRVYIGLDQATSFGWAALTATGERLDSGTFKASPKTGEAPGQRWIDLAAQLTHIAARFVWYPPDIPREEAIRAAIKPWLFYEISAPLPGSQSWIVAGGMIAIMEVAAAQAGVRIQGIHYSTVKRIATGNGNAKKGLMAKAANDRWGRGFALTQDENGTLKPILPADGDEADALWIAETGRRHAVEGLNLQGPRAR